MNLISHRGNIEGSVLGSENSPMYVRNAIQKGYDVEVDFWAGDNGLYLGHDFPTYQITEDFLNIHKNKLWIHCKNLEGLYYLSTTDYNYFWHQEDDYTLTSKGYIWTYPGRDVVYNSVIVCQDLVDSKKMSKQNIHGICSDYVGLL